MRSTRAETLRRSGAENTRVPSNETIKSFIRNAVPRPVRNWLRSPFKSLEWLSDSAHFSPGITKTLEFPPGIRIAMHPHAYKIACMAQIAEPEERAEFNNFISHCTPGMFFFDIGAHYGLFSIVAAHFDGRAVSVDPSQIAIRMIDRQTALNHVETRVRPVPAAVSDSSGLVEMLSSGVFSAGYFKFAKGRPASELTKVRAVTIDEMTREFGIPTHVKIDVEG